jgi:zinc transport system substrate-binding protein
MVVAVSAYPLAWLVENVGGERVRILELISTSSDLHDAELEPAAVEQVSSADLVVLLGDGLQPGVDEALATRGVSRERVLKTLDRLIETGAVASDLESKNTRLSHFWLDPVLMEAAASAVASAMGETRPVDREYFQQRLETLDANLSNLNQAFARSLERCRSRTLVVYHAAYGSMATRYRLDVVAVVGADPEAEPRPADLQKAVSAAKSSGVRAVFSDPESGKEAMEQVGRQAGIPVEILDPIEVREAGTEYDARMYSNLSKVTAALGCS